MVKKHKTADEKNNIVKYAKNELSRGKSKKEITVELGIIPNTLKRYMDDYEKNGPYEDEVGYDASPTWSGFQYQGKVAIFHSLKIINENRGDNNFCEGIECENYNLEFEKIEDFSIKDIKDELKYYSIHQVKAYSSTNNSTYIKAIAKTEESVDSLSITGQTPSGYLHIMKKVPLIKSSPKVEIYNYIIDGSTQNYCELSQIEELIKAEICKSTILNRILTEEETDIFYLIVINEVDKLVRERHEDIIKNKRKEAHIRPYPLCKICEVLRNKQEMDQQYWVFNLKKVFMNNFEEYMVIKQDSTSQIEQDKISEIVYITEGDIESLNILINKPNKLELAKEISLTKVEYEDSFIQYIKKQWEHYHKIDDFLNLCKTITPHKIIKGEITAQSFHQLIPDQSLQECYFEIIELFINNDTNYNDKGLFFLNDNRYLATNINERGDTVHISSRIEKIKNDITNNPANIETLFEVDTLVSKDLNIGRLKYSKIKNGIEPDDKDSIDYKEWLKWEKGITHIKDIEVINENELKRRLSIL